MSSRYRNSKRLEIPLRKRGLILCEGETEVFYFKGLKSHTDNMQKLLGVSVDIYKPKNHSPLGLVTEAIAKIRKEKRAGNAYDFVWLVFDNDGHANMPDAFDKAYTSRNPSIEIGFTNRCFEYFILLHFEYTTRSFTRCADIISYICENHNSDYEKAKSGLYDLLHPNKETGLTNSQRVLDYVRNDIENGSKPYQLSCYTNIHKLVEFLEAL